MKDNFKHHFSLAISLQKRFTDCGLTSAEQLALPHMLVGAVMTGNMFVCVQEKIKHVGGIHETAVKFVQLPHPEFTIMRYLK